MHIGWIKTSNAHIGDAKQGRGRYLIVGLLIKTDLGQLIVLA